MRLDRNNGHGKYAIINLRKYGDYQPGSGAVRPSAIAVSNAMQTLKDAGLIEYGAPGTEHEFLVLMLKDRFAKEPIEAYFDAIEHHALFCNDKDVSKSLHEYSEDIWELAERAGKNSPWCKVPD